MDGARASEFRTVRVTDERTPCLAVQRRFCTEFRNNPKLATNFRVHSGEELSETLSGNSPINGRILAPACQTIHSPPPKARCKLLNLGGSASAAWYILLCHGGGAVPSSVACRNIERHLLACVLHMAFWGVLRWSTCTKEFQRVGCLDGFIQLPSRNPRPCPN